MSVMNTKVAQAESLEVLAKQATETYTGSVVFMKQLTTIAISTITYLKNIFQEDSYNVELFSGIRVRILKRKSKDEMAHFVSTSLTQAFEAFDKKYLQKLALCFYNGESCNAENLLEYFAFEYLYNEAGVTMDLTTKTGDSALKSQFTFERVREKTVQLIRTCVVMMESQCELPPSYDVSLRLYYNDAAPEGYQAPGFLSTLERDDHLEILDDPRRMGSIQTPYHRLVARTYVRDAIVSSNDAEPSQNAPTMTQMEEFDGGSPGRSPGGSPGRSPGSEPRSLAGRVRCPCTRDDRDDELMLTCNSCGSLQHGACFGRLRAPAAHVCERCARAPAPGVDLRLLDLTDKKRECLCILRRSLQWLQSQAALEPRALALRLAMSRDNAGKLVRVLTSYGVLEDRDQGSMAPRKILHHQLRALMQKHFYLEESELVERLVAETAAPGAAPGAARDPLAAVLRPMEQVSLHNDTALGKIISPPTKEPVIEDATLLQYKEAVLSSHNIEEDLPLSGNHNPAQDMDMIGKKSAKRKAGKENVRGVKAKRAKTVPK